MATLPEHIAVGKFVRVAEWVGRVEDIANGGQNTMIQVSSPKQVYRHSCAEWLQYFPDNPDLIKPATADEYADECRYYANRASQDAERIIALLERAGAVA